MKNLKKKFIAVVILFIISILGIETYKAFIVSGEDRNSYVILIDGEGQLNNKNLVLNEKQKLKVNDKITTLTEKSLAIIKWGDGSITRLGGNSVLVINENQIEKNLLNIKISFTLESGKSWSDVISFIGKDSYFNQSFADTTAAVRGTIFEVNLENDYVYVESHEVILSKQSGKTIIIPEKRPFIISNFSFTKLIKFIQNFKDNSWQKLNKKLDEEYYRKLKEEFNKISKELLKKNEELQSKLDNIGNLTKEKKEALQKELLKNYQKMKFISVDDINNYKNKLSLKQDLIKISKGKDKENLILTSVYDIKSLVKNKQFDDLSKIIYILGQNSDILKNKNIDLKNYINVDVFNNLQIPEGLKQEFNKSFLNLKNNLNLDTINSPLIDSIKDSVNTSLDGVKDNLKNIKQLIK